MKRSLRSYAECTANGVASGSKVQMMYFVEDAKADIATLANANSDLLREAKALVSFFEQTGLTTEFLSGIRVAIAKAEIKP